MSDAAVRPARLAALAVGSPAAIAVVFAVLAALPVFANLYFSYIGGIALIYVILSLGLNLLIGSAGQFALAHAAMFGIGAYVTGLLQVDAGLPYALAAPVGILAASMIGTALALPALRLSGIYLAIATLAFAQATVWVFANWTGVTYGANGFSVPPVDFSPLPVRSEIGVYYLTWAVAALLVVFTWNLMASRVGRAFTAMRDDPAAAQALGIDLLGYKATAFALSGLYAGIAGALFSAIINFVSPESFGLFQIVIIKAMIVVGGLGSVAGSVFGAILLVVLLEAVREVPSLQEAAFGAILLVFMLLQPKGLVGFLQVRVPGWREGRHREPSGRRADAAAPPSPAAAENERSASFP